jgi:hypothetical protein
MSDFGTCLQCGHIVRITKAGFVRMHGHNSRKGYGQVTLECSGSFLPCEEIARVADYQFLANKNTKRNCHESSTKD